MAIITLPAASCKRGQPLDVFYHDLVDFRYSNGQLIDVKIEQNNIILTGSFDLAITDISLILANGGKIEQMLSAILVSDWNALKLMQVMDTLPWNKNIITGLTRTFTNWLNQGEVWANASNQAIFYTNPRSKSADDYLTGEHLKVIHDMAVCEQVTLNYANSLISAGGWTKYV